MNPFAKSLSCLAFLLPAIAFGQQIEWPPAPPAPPPTLVKHVPSRLEWIQESIARAHKVQAGGRSTVGLPGNSSNVSAQATAPGSPQAGLRAAQNTGFAPTATVTGDFNGDGQLDWATAMGGDNTIWVYLGRGDGTSQLPIILALSGKTPVGLAAADLRKNGKLDLVVAEAGSSTLGVLLNNGDGTFQPESEYALPANPESLVIGDFNGDGKLDAIVGNNGQAHIGPVAFLPGDGAGHFGKPVYQASPELDDGAALAAGDFNKDGKLDLMVTGDDGNSFQFSGNYVLLGKGDGTFTVGQTITEASAGGSYSSGAIADVDGDDCLDAVLFNSFGFAEFAKGNCDGTFALQRPTPTLQITSMGDSLVSGFLADVNGDGNLDIVAGGAQLYVPEEPSFGGGNAGNLIAVAFGDGRGNFSPQATVYPAGANNLALAVADLKHTGKPDIIAPSFYSSTLYVLHNDAQGRFGISAGSSVAYDGTGGDAVPNSVPVVQDLNGDGRPDIAITQNKRFSAEPYGLAVLLQQADGSFSAPVLSSLVPDPQNSNFLSSFAFGNFRGGGVMDVVALTESSSLGLASSYYFAENQGGGHFSDGSGVQLPTEANASEGQLATGDFNGDGKLDVAIVQATNLKVPVVELLLGNGDGTFNLQPLIPLAKAFSNFAFPDFVLVGDFNRDGHPDILVHYTSNGMGGPAYVALGDGRGGFTSVTLISASMGNVASADMNHDGCPDLISTETTTSIPGFVVWLCQTDGSFMALPSFSPYRNVPGWVLDTMNVSSPGISRGLQVGDFDGDGNPDLMITEYDGFDLEELIAFESGNGDGTFTQHLLSTPLHATLGPQFTGDVNADGVTDLLQIDELTNALSWRLGSKSHATFDIQFRALPVSGQEGHLRVFLDQVQTQPVTMTLSSSDPETNLISQITVPAGQSSADVDFSLSPSFNYAHVFTITAISGTESHQVLGYAVNQTVAALDFTPALLDFGQVDIGIPGPNLTAILTNFGSGPLTHLNLQSTSAGFSIASTTCGTQLAPGANCTAQISTIGGEGYLQATGDQGSAAVPMFSIGVPVSTSVSFSPATLTFHGKSGQTSAPQVITFTNTGQEPLAGMVAVSSGQGFQLSASTCNQTIAPGGTCQASVVFSPPPQQVGPFQGNAGFLGDVTAPVGVPLTGILSSGQLQASPTSIDFGQVPAGGPSATQVITLENTTTDSVFIDVIQQTPNLSGTTTCQNVTLTQNQTCTISSFLITGVPAGAFTGSLTVKSSSLGGDIIIPVTANVAGLGLTLAPGSNNSFTFNTGQTASEGLLLSDGGSKSVKLSCTSSGLTCSASPDSVSGPVTANAITVSFTSFRPTAQIRTIPNGLWFVMTLPMFGLLRLRRRAAIALAVIILSIACLSGCGGTSGTPPPSNQQTPPGTYTATVTASDGTNTATMAFTIQVR